MRVVIVASVPGLLLALGCSFVDPRAGAPQAACGIGSGGTSQTTAGSSYYGSSSSPTPSPRVSTCAASTGSACDDCEGTHCCATRSACYGDPVCACADLALDECLDAADVSADRATEIGKCWSTFTAKGTVERERESCQRSWCQAECGVP